MNIRSLYGVRDNGFRNIVRFVAFNDDVARAAENSFEQLRSNAVFALGFNIVSTIVFQESLEHMRLEHCFNRISLSCARIKEMLSS
jgi:hypothetical protein